jgi:hypothetical protein
MQALFYYIKIAEKFGGIRLIFVHYRCFFAQRRMTTAYTAISVTAPPATTEITRLQLPSAGNPRQIQHGEYTGPARTHGW